MTNADAGFASVSIRLALNELQRDAQAAAAKIRSSIPDTTVPVALKLDNSAIAKLATEVQAAKAALAGETASANVAGLQKETQLLQEALRFKAELAKIDDAGFSDEDAQNARILAAELNKINLDRIEQEFVQARAAGEAFTKSLQGELLKAQAGAAGDRGDTGQAAQLQKQAALLQEATRYKKQLADIENAYVDADDLARAKSLADELNGINKQRIEVQFSGGDELPRGLAGQAQAFQAAIDRASLYTQALSQVSDQLLRSGQQVNAFSGQIAQAAIAFDSAKANVATLSSESEAFARQARSLSAELGYQASSTELLTASLDVISAGFDSTAESGEILRASTIAAVGGLTEVATVTDVVTSVLNSYKLEATEAARITDIIAQTVDDGKISFEQYAQGVGRVTGIAAQAGVSIEEVSAAIATATAKGLPAESSISGVRQAIVNLIKPTNDAQAKLEQFGINNVSATLRTEGLVGVLERLKTAGATSDDLAKIFSDVDGLATVSQLAGANLADFKANLDSVNNSAGKSAAAAAEIAKSFQGQLNVALNQANAAMVDMGNGITKAIGLLLPPLTFLLENFNALPVPIKESIGVAIALSGGVLTLAGAVAAVAAVLPSVVAGLRVMGIAAGSAATSTTSVGVAGTAAGAGANVAAAGAAKAGISFRAMASGAGALMIKMGLVAAAIEAVKLVLSRFKNGGESFNRAAEDLQQKMIDLQIESGKTRTAIESALPKKPPPTDWADGLVHNLNEINRATNQQLGLPDDFLMIPTNAEKQLQNARDGVRNLQQTIDQVVEGGNKLALSEGFITNAEKGYKPNTQQIEQAKKQQELYAAALAKTQQELQSLDAAKLGTEAYEQLKTQLEQSIEQIKREKTLFEQRTGVVDESAKASQNAATATDAAASATEKQASAIEKLNDAYSSNTGKLDAANKLAQAQVAESVAQGLITEDQGREQNLENEQRYLNERLKLNEQKLVELRDLLSSTTDPAQVKDLQSQILETEAQVADSRLAIAEKLADARIEAERRATEEIKRQIEDVDRSAQSQKTEVRTAQASGGITKEDADSQVADIEADATQQSIALIERRLAAVQRGSDEERDLIGQLGGLREEAANQEIARQEAIAAAEKKRQEEAIANVERANKAAQSAIDRSQVDRTAQVKQQQAAGVISEAQAADAIRQIQDETARANIAAKEQELASIRQLRDQGVLSAEDAATREMALVEEIGQSNLARIEQELQAQQEASRRRVEEVDRGSENRTAQNEQAQTADITEIRKLERDRVISAQEAQARINQERLESLDFEIAETQRTIAEINQLRANGDISEEDAGDRLRDLNTELVNLSQQRVETEIDAQKQQQSAIEETLDRELELRQRNAEAATGFNELQQSALENQSNLLDAQSKLLAAQSALRQGALEAAIEQAEAAGQSEQAERFRGQLVQEQLAALRQQAQIEQQQLELKAQQLELDIQQRKIQADIATAEAEIAIERAKVNEASAQEIANLERILALRQQQASAINGQAQSQRQALGLERQTLSLQQQARREELQRQSARSQSQSQGQGQGRSQASTGSSIGRSSPSSIANSSRPTIGSMSSIGGSSSGSSSSSGTTGIGGNSGSSGGWRTPAWSDGRSRPTQPQSPATQPQSQQPQQRPPVQAAGLDGLVSNLAQLNTGLSRLIQLLAPNQTQQRQSLSTPPKAATAVAGNTGRSNPAEVDRMVAAIERLSNSPRSITAITPDPIKDVTKLAANMSAARVRRSGL